MIKGNKHIGCTVNDCKYHAKNDMSCRLDHIDVVKHGNGPSTTETTDCGSFEKS